MKRSDFFRHVQGERFIATDLECNPNMSRTDPTLAMSGKQIIQMAQTGRLPQNNMMYKSGVKLEDLTPIDNPYIDTFEGLEYAKTIGAEIKDKVTKLKKQEDMAKKEPLNNNNQPTN